MAIVRKTVGGGNFMKKNGERSEEGKGLSLERKRSKGTITMSKATKIGQVQLKAAWGLPTSKTKEGYTALRP